MMATVHSALCWYAEQENWATEPFEAAYWDSIASGLACDGTTKQSWVSPCGKYQIRICCQQALEIVIFFRCFNVIAQEPN